MHSLYLSTGHYGLCRTSPQCLFDLIQFIRGIWDNTCNRFQSFGISTHFLWSSWCADFPSTVHKCDSLNLSVCIIHRTFAFLGGGGKRERPFVIGADRWIELLQIKPIVRGTRLTNDVVARMSHVNKPNMWCVGVWVTSNYMSPSHIRHYQLLAETEILLFRLHLSSRSPPSPHSLIHCLCCLSLMYS